MPRMRLSDYPDELCNPGYLAARCAPDDTMGFFAVAGVRSIDAAWATVEQGRPRCDAGAIGPFGFHRWLGDRCDCGLLDPPDPTMGHHVLTLPNITWVQVVASALPHGFILYFETNQAVAEQAIAMPHSDCAWTLQELLRLMVEWSMAHTTFGNQQAVAVACHRMLQAWGVPVEVQQAIAAVPPQKVERFLRGDPHARSRTPGCPPLADALDAWLGTLTERAVALGDVRTLPPPS
jgi:hypothetical protein